jgi:hypothetical protein
MFGGDYSKQPPYRVLDIPGKTERPEAKPYLVLSLVHRFAPLAF